MTRLDGRSFVAGERLAGGGARFRALDPSTGEFLDPVYASVSDDAVDRAAGAASSAFEEFGNTPGTARAALLEAIAGRLEAVTQQLVDRAGRETALPPARLQGEAARTCAQLRLFAALITEGSWVDARIDPGDRDRTPLPRPDVRSMLRPLGPVAVFGASNFPIAFSVAGGDTASALAAGCPVIVKAHPAHPGTSEIAAGAVRDAVERSGLPPGVFSLLFDAGYGLGLALVRHRLVKAVGFTGSRRAGRILMDAAAARPDPVPVYAEMGSVNPVCILPGAMRERGDAIARGLHASVIQGVGQFCTNPGLVFVVRDAASDGFIQTLAALIGADQPAPMLTPDIGRAYRHGAARLETTAGVTRRSDADPAEASDLLAGRSAVFVTDAATFRSTPRLSDEVFGPCTLIVQCVDVDEMRNAILGLEGQLSAALHVAPGEIELHADLIPALETRVGRLIIDGFPTGIEVNHAMVHGGPYPATSDGRSTSVGTRAIQRFTRPVCYQGFPDDALPPELRNGNPLAILRLVDGEWTRR